MTVSENNNIRTFRGVKYDILDPKFEGLSKQKIKRLLKDEQWNEHKDEKRALFRQKEKARKQERKRQIREGLLEASPTKKKLAATSELTNINLVIDCSFNHLMTEREIVSFVKQLGISYGKNKTAPKSTKLSLVSLDDGFKDVLNEKWPSWKNWGEKHVSTTEQSYLDKFEKNDLIYLSADSDNVIQELEEGKAYIIGGIVDKNRHKNLCQDKATKQGIKTAKLPIEDYLNMSTRKVLTVNQVCEILLKWLEVRDWEKAFLSALPGRKLKDVEPVC
ncbi:hypothetical protein G6F62_001295 [Rhizopus arrhizus]|nr:hypothetical protein G6F62_001295 [Rhizopus arrhizus]